MLRLNLILQYFLSCISHINNIAILYENSYILYESYTKVFSF